MGFTLYFHFSPNDYFTNEVLTKTYELKCEPQEDDPFSFEVNIDLQSANITINLLTPGPRNHQVHRKFN